MCTKKGYKTKKQAKRFAKHVLPTHGFMHTYLCKKCNKYHVGHESRHEKEWYMELQ